MVTLSEFKENVKTLLKQYLYTKEETRQNFDNFINNNLCYSNGELCLAENYIYYNSGEDINLHNPQNAIITTNNGFLTITTNTSGEKKVNLPTQWFDKNDNVYMEMTYCGGSSQPIAICFNRQNNTTFGWVSHNGVSSFSNALSGSGTNVTATISLGDVFRLERNQGVSKFYQNGTLLFQTTRTFTENFRLGFYTNKGRSQSWKNIKVGRI